MRQRVADILINELARQGCGHVFLLTGGGVMHLVDALGRSTLDYVCCHHEQTASIAAQAYAMQKNDLGVCMVTTGPGGTNALTGCAASFMDSTPVLFLSGQVKTDDFASKRQVRQFGAQENDIVAMASPVTKYARLVENPQDALYELQKAIYLSLHGRRGPVWLDVPLDVQAMQVEESSLRLFDPAKEAKDIAAIDPTIAVQTHPDEAALSLGLERTLELLASSRRPLILIGHGLTAAGARDSFQELSVRLGVPVLSTWRGVGVLDHENPLFFGSPGLQAPRYSNIIIQEADFLLVLGSRMDNMITAFSEKRFAHRARKVVVDVDVKEIAKLDMPDLTPVVCDVGVFVNRLAAELPQQPVNDIGAWKSFCTDMRSKFPLLEEKQDKPLVKTNLYKAATAISEYSTVDDVVVVTSTSRCNSAGHMAFNYKSGQRSVSSMGFGSMGFALPSVIGAWFASRHRIIMLEGDGSLQLNIQELQTICHHRINAKLFVFSNGGYAAIVAMQDRNFSGFHVGSDDASGVSLPSLEKIATAYGIPYMRLLPDSLDEDVRRTLNIDGPVLCEIPGDIHFDEIPKCISSINAEGRIVSAALENPYPFLSEAEMSALHSRLSDQGKQA